MKILRIDYLWLLAFSDVDQVEIGAQFSRYFFALCLTLGVRRYCRVRVVECCAGCDC